MGNNNSASTVQVSPHPHWTPQSNSVDPDDHRGRMKRGYLPPRHYNGQRVPPQKVLPSLNPVKAAQKLKPTSNGLNLKQCGTISGRKFNEAELDLPSRPHNPDGFDARGQRHISRNQNNNNGVLGTTHQNGHSSPSLFVKENLRREGDLQGQQGFVIGRTEQLRFFESEPELHQVGRHQDLSNIMSIPSPTTFLLHESPAKKQIRSKKKKSPPVPPAVKKGNIFYHSGAKPSSLVQEIPKVHHRMFKTKAEGRILTDTNGVTSNSKLPSTSSQRTDSRNSSVPSTSTTASQPKRNETKVDPVKRSTSSTSHTPPPSFTSSRPSSLDCSKNSDVHSKSSQKSPAQKFCLPYSSPPREKCEKWNGFRRSMDNRNTSQPKESKAFNLEIQKETPKVSKIQQNGSNQIKSKPNVTQEEAKSKKCFYFGMDMAGSLEAKSNNFRPVGELVEKNVSAHVPRERAITESSNLSTSTQGFTYKLNKEESLSDHMSSSSEMDIVLRPTLPPKRQQLPKFSPAAAWNRIDLESPTASEEEVSRFQYRNRELSRTLEKVCNSSSKLERVGEGDSGISGLDGDGGGSPEILPPPIIPNTPKSKCWTPEQDLDDSSSEFDPEENEPQQNHTTPAYKSSERPRLTTKRNFFTSSKSDTEGKEEPIYARSTKSKRQPLSLGPIDTTTNHPLEFNPSLKRIINYRRSQMKEMEHGLDANWFLSRSEPNSLNMIDLFVSNEPKHGRADDDEIDGICSENGYAPSHINFDLTEGNGNFDWNKSNSLISLSHIVYLPQQYEEGTSRRNRKTRSVENLLSHNENQTQLYRYKDREPSQKTPDIQVNPTNKRKKFKFQSTLKVLERKRIEKELTREAEEKEMERLREIEVMKRVESEFQRKRRSKEVVQNTCSEDNQPFKSVLEKGMVTVVTMSQWDNNHIPQPSTIGERNCVPLQSSNTSSASSSNNRTPIVSKILLTQRQDPEGAPSVVELRKELIQGSRKRNGISSASSDLTQELSEFRQETRQYCDYRRSPRINTNSSSPARFTESSSSDIYPLNGRIPFHDKQKQRPKPTVVHPEIVCDIPNKPFPFMVNVSRLSGSHTSLLIEEQRPTSGIGYTSGPSSVISDNYRRDWAHYHNKSSIPSVPAIGDKCSSSTSLHSMSDNFRPNQSEHTSVVANTPKIIHRVIRSRSPAVRKNQSSPVPLSPPLNSNGSNESSVNIKGGLLPSSAVNFPETCLQPQSFTNYKTKAYRPVVFNPTNSNRS